MTNIENIKQNIQITDYARYLGFTPVKVGRWYSLKEHDSVRIDPERNIFFRNSTGEHGSIIDFAMAFTGEGLQDVMRDLKKYLGEDPEPARMVIKDRIRGAKNDILVLPDKDKDHRNVFAYLTKTRNIDKAVVSFMLKKRYLYQDTKKNCVFVSYEGERPIFASLRGTNTHRRYVADVPGSDYTKGQLFRNGRDILCITESVIDAMSLMTLTGDPEKYDYLSLSGVGKTEPIYYYIEKDGYKGLIFALDNDEAGIEAASAIKEEIITKGLMKEDQIVICLPDKKDWNEELKEK